MSYVLTIKNTVFVLAICLLTVFGFQNCADGGGESEQSAALGSDGTSGLNRSLIELNVQGAEPLEDNHYQAIIDKNLIFFVYKLGSEGVVCTEVTAVDANKCLQAESPVLNQFSPLTGQGALASGAIWSYDSKTDLYALNFSHMDIHFNAGKIIKYFFYDPTTQSPVEAMTIVFPSLGRSSLAPAILAYKGDGTLTDYFDARILGKEVIYNCGEDCTACTEDLESSPGKCTNEDGSPVLDNFNAIKGTETDYLSSVIAYDKNTDTWLMDYSAEFLTRLGAGRFRDYVYNPDTNQLSVLLAIDVR